MKKANLKLARKKESITFLFEAEQAEKVYLVGEFNGWNAEWHPMEKDENGTWFMQLLLPEGEYEYKFYVDDQWKTDPRNVQERLNCSGSRNSILTVG